MPRDIVREGISMMNDSRRRGTAVHRLIPFLPVSAWSRFGGFSSRLTGFPKGAWIFSTLTGEEWFWKPGDRLELPPEPIIIKGETIGGIGFVREP